MERRMARFIQGDRPEAGVELAMTVGLTQQLLASFRAESIRQIETRHVPQLSLIHI